MLLCSAPAALGAMFPDTDPCVSDVLFVFLPRCGEVLLSRGPEGRRGSAEARRTAATAAVSREVERAE